MIDGKVWECQLQSNNSVIFRPKLEQSAIPAPSECMDSLENEFYLGETWVSGCRIVTDVGIQVLSQLDV